MKGKSFDAGIFRSIQEILKKQPDQRLKILDSVSSNLHLRKDRKQSAVFIPLCNRQQEASILFTIRTEKVGTHKGQVSFPGGHIDSGESDIEAAVREMYEELGIRPDAVTVLGRCQTIPAITGTLVTPIIGYVNFDVGNFEGMIPSEDEVSSVFSRTVDQLVEPGYRQYELLSRNEGIRPVRMPYFGPIGQRERIWGLTGLILASILDKVVIPSLAEVEKQL